MLSAKVETIKGVGPARVTQLHKLGIYTAEDLLCHLPRDYRDLTQCHAISEMRTGQPWFGLLTMKEDARLSYIRRGLNILRVRAEDESGTVVLVFYNQPFYKNSLLRGRQYYIYGTPVHSGGEIRLLNPMMEAKEQSEGLRMLPVYRTTVGLSQTVLRKIIRQCLVQYGDTIQDMLPRSLRERYGLMSLRDAYEFAHFPVHETVCRQAVNALAFTELLLLRLFLMQKRMSRANAQSLVFDAERKEKYLSSIGFSLTNAQLRVMEQIDQDIQKTEPMSRLLQGDVGSGKTVLAFYALYVATCNGKQGAMMAPTELLALQHYRAAQPLFQSFGLRTACIRSGMKAKERREILEDVASNRIQIIFGTHALLQQGVTFKDPGVIVVDEQHRFGVKQRAQLLAKTDQSHALFLSATPIPRTLALIVYGDLDLSVLDEMPPGRMPVKTHIVSPNKQQDMMRFLAQRVDDGQQGYIVCPKIEQQEDGIVTSAEELYAQICGDERLRAGLMHGRMKTEERDAVMEKFMTGEVGVLVSTTVVEVGVDVSNATVMIVQNAERFGLAQLHQLRGRVGRGKEQSYCFLCTEDGQNQRLQALCATQNGFLIAQKDLEQRGPGEFLGEEQHGRADVRLSGMLRDTKLLEQVIEAYKWLETEMPVVIHDLSRLATGRYERPMADIALN